MGHGSGLWRPGWVRGFSPSLSFSQCSILQLAAVLFFHLAIESAPARAGDHPTWIELRSPHFIVLTNAGEGKARTTAHQFEMIREVFRKSSGQKGESAELPLTILAAKDENTLKAVLPEFWAKKGSM